MEEIKIGPGPYGSKATVTSAKEQGPVIVHGKTYPAGTTVRFVYDAGAGIPHLKAIPQAGGGGIVVDLIVEPEEGR